MHNLLFIGVLGQTILQDKVESALESTKTKDSSTLTGINSIWEPSSDDANPFSVSIIKITPTLAPIIEITPTSSTSQQKEALSSTATFSVEDKFSKEPSASSHDSVSSSTVISPKKTSEKKIERPKKGYISAFETHRCFKLRSKYFFLC